MSLHEPVGVAGVVCITARDRRGRLVLERRVRNLVTLEGRKLLGRALAGEKGLTGMLSMAVGTGRSAPALRNTQLEAQTAVVPIHNTPQVAVEDDRVVLRVTATFERLPEGQQEELREAGIVIRLPDGADVLFNRVSFGAVTRSADLEISLSWDVLF